MTKESVSLVFLIASMGFAQEPAEEPAPTACDHPILQKAKVEGLNSLTLTEIPQYWLRSWQCRRYAKKRGQKVDFRVLARKKRQENYEEATEISGLGSCYATVVVLVLFYSYAIYFTSR